jgi:hypothetical protein
MTELTVSINAIVDIISPLATLHLATSPQFHSVPTEITGTALQA